MKKRHIYMTVLAIMTGSATMPTYAGIPTIDVTNIVQSTITAIESVAQTAKQVQQYQKQLQQYQNMLKNTMKPSSYIWSDAQQTIQNLLSAVNTLQYYRNQLGGIDSYLDKFGNLEYYKGLSCYSDSGCTQADRQKIAKSRRIASKTRLHANDAMLRGLKQQQKTLRRDAQKLRQLQAAAEGAQGRMAALQYANQFAAQQTSQLLQMRSLLVAQQHALVAGNEARIARRARWQAADKEYIESDLGAVPSPDSW